MPWFMTMETISPHWALSSYMTGPPAGIADNRLASIPDLTTVTADHKGPRDGIRAIHFNYTGPRMDPLKVSPRLVGNILNRAIPRQNLLYLPIILLIREVVYKNVFHRGGGEGHLTLHPPNKDSLTLQKITQNRLPSHLKGYPRNPIGAPLNSYHLKLSRFIKEILKRFRNITIRGLIRENPKLNVYGTRQKPRGPHLEKKVRKGKDQKKPTP